MIKLNSRLNLFAIVAAITVSAPSAFGQFGPPVLPENATQKVSDHVHVIMGFPNVAIVVGTKATLVVDTGMGPRNGQIITREVQKLTKNPTIYLTTTHFHPEHAAGEGGFPAGTIIIRNKAQQDELDANGAQMIEMFAKMNATNKELLTGVKLRTPDVVFEKELKLDLGGGVTARLLEFEGGHTRGDELIMVEPDSTLISGDIVEKKLVPSLFGDNSSYKRWMATIAQVEPLKPKFVVPTHGDLGDGSLVQSQKNFMQDLLNRALFYKKQNVPVEDAANRVTADMRTKYPDWPNLNGVANAVKKIYSEY
jgi:glyoxylase-like metal-dependent hydrolase (beta-lactamase superfamily II)